MTDEAEKKKKSTYKKFVAIKTADGKLAPP
jgi:hypothetical protein